MNLEKLEIEHRVNLLYEMLEASHGLSHWVYDSDGELIQTNAQETVMDTIFAATGCKQAMTDRALSSDVPLMLSASLGLLWIADYEKYDGKVYRMHVLGPAFHTEISLKTIQRELQNHQVSGSWKLSFTKSLSHLPTISANSLQRMSIMLHYCVTGEKITVNDLAFQTDNLPTLPETERKDRHRTWMAEQNLLGMVREGNLDYQSAVTQSSSLSSGVGFHADSPITQARVSVIVFTSLCTRAAIDGGILPDIAYAIGDSYIQQANDCETISLLSSVSHDMYDHFVRLVHDHKRRTDLSKPIQACLDYVQLHLEDEIDLPQLAKRLGYADYYLTKKFRQEMDISLNEYIRKARIERACTLLTTTEDSLQEISDRLHFSSRSYFSVVFKDFTGMTPADYRAKNQNA